MVLIMYLIMRRDLLAAPFNWPLGALMAQAAHASTAAIWENLSDPDVIAYMKATDSMRKVVLQIESEEDLLAASESLLSASIKHKLWIEQPENIPTCIATKPCEKSQIGPHLKKFSLFN